MKKITIISRTPAKDVTVLTDNISEALELALEDTKPSDIIISTSGENTYKDATIALSNQVKVMVNGTLVKPSEVKTAFDRTKFLFTVANTIEQVQVIEQKLTRVSLKMVPSKMSFEELMLVLEESANNNLYKKAVISRIKEAHEERVQKIVNMVSIKDRQDVVHVDPNVDIIEFIKSNPGIHYDVSDLGNNKTNNLKELFEYGCNNGKYPLFVNSSRALSSSMVKEGDERFYMNAVKGHFDERSGRKFVDIQKGIVGVTNTVFMSEDLKAQRDLMEMLLADEFEDVLDHNVSDAINKGTLDDKIKMNQRLKFLFNKAKNIVLCDGMPSTNSLERIKKMAGGKTIYVHNRPSPFAKPKVRIMSQGMAINSALENIKAGNKIGVFNDGSHSEKKSKVNEVIEALKSEASFNYDLIDGAFMSNSERALEMHNPNSFAAKNDVIFFNTAAKCGLSITDQDYKNMIALLHQTATPNGAIQSFKRMRPTEQVDAWIDATYKKLPLTEFSVLNQLMYSELSPENVTEEKYKELSDNEDVKDIVNRLVHRNNMKNDYINTMMIMLDALGYEVELVEDEKEKKTSGNAAKNAGKDAEREIRVNNVINADKISDTQAKKLEATADYNSQENKNRLENFNLRDFYNVDEVTEELMDFDNQGKGRTCINNMEIARTENGQFKNSVQLIKHEMIKKFFELTDLNPETFGTYNATHADAFQNFVETGSIKINDKKAITAKEAFSVALPDCNLNKRSMSTVSSILTIMFRLDKPKKAGRTQGKTNYEALPNEKAEMHYQNIFGSKNKQKAA